MRTNGLHLLELVRQHFARLDYRCLGEQIPDFDGIILYLQPRRGDQEAAYCLFKPSQLDLVTSNELRQVMECVEETGTPLQHVVTTSSFSHGSRELSAKNGLFLWELHSQGNETAHVVCVHSAHRSALFFS